VISTEPDGQPIDPLKVQMGFLRERDDRPWVMANFVSSIDGAATIKGGSTPLSDDDDRAMFHAIRAVPDFILVGAGTVRAENYGPTHLDEKRRQARVEAGLEPAPHLVIVSGSLDLDPDARVFSDPEHRVTVLTHESSPSGRFDALSDVADVVRLGSTDAGDVIHYLRMAKVVLCEGGPSLMGQLIAADLIDEMALTVSPLLVAGDAPRIAHGRGESPPLDMTLDRVLYGSRSLFLRYLRAG
jgi:riboflavin biosynthesis pyrimidine reductase